MKIYLAAWYSRNAEMRSYREVLHSFGHQVTSRWIDQHGGSLEEALGSQELTSSPGLGMPFALKDIEDIDAADTFVAFNSENNEGRGGRHWELGYAYACRRRIVLVGPREHVFHTLPGILHYQDWYKLLDAIESGGW